MRHQPARTPDVSVWVRADALHGAAARTSLMRSTSRCSSVRNLGQDLDPLQRPAIRTFHSANAALALVMLSTGLINLALNGKPGNGLTHTDAGRASVCATRIRGHPARSSSGVEPMGRSRWTAVREPIACRMVHGSRSAPTRQSTSARAIAPSASSVGLKMVTSRPTARRVSIASRRTVPSSSQLSPPGSL